MKALCTLAVGVTTVLSLGVASQAQQYKQTNLVSSTSGIAPVTDPALVDPWGLTRNDNPIDMNWWVSDNDTGLSTLYNGVGVKIPLTVTIPSVNPKKNPKGSPTGTIGNNSTTDFMITSGQPAAFVFSTLDGGIVAWNPTIALSPGQAPPSTNAVLVAKGADGSSYTGLTSGFIKNNRVLYAANFAKGRIDVYDSSFHLMNLGEDSNNSYAFDELRNRSNNKAFTDDLLPKNFAPFNVQTIGPNVVVTYGLRVEGQQTAVGGQGLGYVDLYSASGQLLTRFEHGDWLNAPWGLALAPLDFGRFSHDLLVGQFGGGGSTSSAGTIAAYDLATGKFEGTVEDSTGKPVVISGIWALSPGNVAPDNLDPAGSPSAEVYFTARNAGKGLFGYLTAITSNLTEGNAQ
jgi:uncharacterized protein (TIGR03118 family)